MTDQRERPSSDAIQDVLRWLLGRESAPFKRCAPKAQVVATYDDKTDGEGKRSAEDSAS